MVLCSPCMLTHIKMFIDLRVFFCLLRRFYKEKLDAQITQSSTVTGRFQATVTSNFSVGLVYSPDGTSSWAVDPQYKVMETQ